MRTVQVLVTGLGGLAAVLLVTFYSNIAVTAFSAVIVILVLVGFLIPVPRWLPSIGSAVEKDWNGAIAGTTPFPQMVVFQSEIRNLWLLVLAPLYALYLAGVMLSTMNDPAYRDLGAEAIVSPSVFHVITYAAVFFAWCWFRERMLLRKAMVGIGYEMGRPAGFHPQVSYQYFDAEGERRGGVSFVWSTLTMSFPVFMHDGDPDFSKPGFGFLFHKFAVIDAKSVPSSVLAGAQKRIALRLRAQGTEGEI